MPICSLMLILSDICVMLQYQFLLFLLPALQTQIRKIASTTMQYQFLLFFIACTVDTNEKNCYNNNGTYISMTRPYLVQQPLAEALYIRCGIFIPSPILPEYGIVVNPVGWTGQVETWLPCFFGYEGYLNSGCSDGKTQV